MADRPTDPTAQTDTDRKVPHESKPHPEKGRPSTSTGESTRATDSKSGLGSDKPMKLGALRMVVIVVVTIVVVLVVVGLFG